MKTMRQIKFRAWDKERKVMYSPTSINWDKDGKTLWVCDIHGTNTLEYELINPTSEIMQYTGLKDKNGKEIYEGDIIKCGNGSEGVMVWSQKIMMYRFDTTQTINGWNHPTEGFDGDDLEIIGNIYENPELLLT